ncbi:MAG: 1-deoxy-D-xylulose-5-phosphate synthase [Spirochaetia bacterium]|jgi:transketolase|nr:1-deoxy-D-xylulose-5-phosphate synthase [Spirochaetia bacterium]
MSEAMRDAWGMALVSYGEEHPELVVLDADVSSSTKSRLFGERYPERFFNLGVAEGNMVGTAAGLATAGFHPVVNAFAIFLALKASDQIRNDICYNSLPVVIAGAYGGLSDSFDGASHQSIADIAIMRAFPNMQVIVPADAGQAEAALAYAMVQHGPVYVRLNRNAMPDLPFSADFAKGKAICCRKGSDVTIAANGITASLAMEAAEKLSKDGIEAEVLSVPFVKPLDVDGLAGSVVKTGRILTVEEHNLIGGFSGAVSEAFMKKDICCRFDSIGIEDRFTETGPYLPLLAAYGISSEHIAKRATALCK